MEQTINFNKYADGLVPAIVQDANTRVVLMLGFMNQAAIDKTLAEKKVCFFSRSKQRLWTKGEESGHFLHFVRMDLDCDGDSLLIQVQPVGAVCHLGPDTCWAAKNEGSFLHTLESIIAARKSIPKQDSYVSSLFEKGLNKIAQKVGEEAVELVIEAKDNQPALFLNESADLLFHYLILLQAKGHNLDEVLKILEKRHRS